MLMTGVPRFSMVYSPKRDRKMSSEARTGKVLINATRPYCAEQKAKSWWVTLSALTYMVLALGVAVLAPSLGMRLAASVLAGLLVVRVFVLYHDFMHGAILRKSLMARVLYSLFGLWVLVPPRVWKQTHNYHHAHTAKLVGSNVGSYKTVNIEMWQEMSRGERIMYKLTRHPLTIAFGYLTIFIYGMCISSFLRNPSRHWDSVLSLALHAALSVAMWIFLGPEAYVLALLLPLIIASAAGGYLFYAQHNFPGVEIASREAWTYTNAAVRSSSFLKMGPVMNWFTGNIGYHHVHHLNATIPFYRLPEAMKGIPELQTPLTTSLWPRDILACFRLKLWDPERGCMVGYPS